MKIRQLAQHWEQNAAGRLSPTGHVLHLDMEAEARLAALEELEASFPYVKGQQVIATDEEGDPLYEDIGPTPRFLALSRRHLQALGRVRKDPSH